MALSLQVLLPQRPDCPTPIDVDANAVGEELVAAVAKEAGVAPKLLTLFARNMDGVLGEGIVRITDGATLREQSVRAGALITCMVEEVSTVADGADAIRTPGPPAPAPAQAAADGEPLSPENVVGSSLDEEDEVEADEDDIRDSIRQRANELVSEAVENANAAFVGDGAEGVPHEEHRLELPPPLNLDGPLRNIGTYSWADRKATVKVYIAADSEPDVVAAAGDGPGAEVQTQFAELGVTMAVRGAGVWHVLELRNLRGPIDRKRSRCVVSAGKRITLELRKLAEGEEWPTLLRPWASASELAS